MLALQKQVKKALHIDLLVKINESALVDDPMLMVAQNLAVYSSVYK